MSSFFVGPKEVSVPVCDTCILGQFRGVINVLSPYLYLSQVQHINLLLLAVTDAAENEDKANGFRGLLL